MAGSSSGQVAELKRRSALVGFLIRLVKEKPLGTVGGVITLLLLFVGIFADFLAPYGMNETHTADTLAAPSATYWLGTDDLGRDLLTRIIYGARTSLIIGLSGSALATFISATLGMMCGYFGGKFDLITQRFVDAVMCFPGLVLLMIVMSMVGPGMIQVILVLGLSWGITGSRYIRGPTMSIKQNVYMEAAIAAGCSTTRIFTRHVLPNVAAPIIILFSIRVPTVVLTEASLSFLGFGIPPPTPSWGAMLSGTGRSFMFQAPWMVIWPGLALSTVVYGVNMLGDAVRDILDPRMRGGGGRYGVKIRKSEPTEQNKEAPMKST